MKSIGNSSAKSTIIYVIIFVVIWGGSFLINKQIDIKQQIDAYEREYVSGKEFVRTIDCAPIFDLYGEGTSYKISFEIKADLQGRVQVYQQNGSTSRYSFYESIDVTTEYQSISLTVTPVLENEAVAESYWAFYGEYCSGVVPSIRYIEITKI